MDYSGKNLDWLKQRLTTVYSSFIPADLNSIPNLLLQLDYNRLINNQISDFNDLSNTEKIANVLSLSYQDVMSSQIKNLANKMTKEQLDFTIKNLPDNVVLDDVSTEKVKQIIVSIQHPNVPIFVTEKDIPFIMFLTNLNKTSINPYL